MLKTIKKIYLKIYLRLKKPFRDDRFIY